MVYIRVPEKYDGYRLWPLKRLEPEMELIGKELLTIPQYVRYKQVYDNFPDFRDYGIEVTRRLSTYWFFGARFMYEDMERYAKSLDRETTAEYIYEYVKKKGIKLL